MVAGREVEASGLADEPLDSVIRGLMRSEGSAFSGMVLENVETQAVYDESGVASEQGVLTVDYARVRRVGERIVRGLFFSERRKPVPEQYRVDGRLLEDGLIDIIRSYAGNPFSPLRSVQEGIFVYSYVAAPDDPDSTLWVGALYHSVPFVGWTGRG